MSKTKQPAGGGEGLGSASVVARDRIARSGNDLALIAERYIDAVEDCAMKRELLAGLHPNSDYQPLAWDQLQQAEEVETDMRRALERAVYYWRKYTA